MPDLKWDQTSMNAMVSCGLCCRGQGRADEQYLTAITQTRSLRSMRDLTHSHLPLLRNIKAKVEETVKHKYGVDKGKLRLFVHYQPTYCTCLLWLFCRTPTPMADEVDHFHVHVVHIAHEGFAGMWVGKAHLLDDLISLVSHGHSSC